jgi:hypothetical protein
MKLKTHTMFFQLAKSYNTAESETKRGTSEARR